jgi:hypothetical protein
LMIDSTSGSNWEVCPISPFCTRSGIIFALLH